jgi:anti-anti-sigma factor
MAFEMFEPHESSNDSHTEFQASVVHRGGHPIIVLEGEIDLAAGDSVRACIAEALRTSPRVEFDLSGVTFMGSTGINMLLLTCRATGGLQETVTLRSPSAAVMRVLELTAVDRAFTVAGDHPGHGSSRQRQ